MNLELPICLLDWIDVNKIDFNILSSNGSFEAIQFLKKNPDKICWTYLSLNPNAEAIQ